MLFGLLLFRSFVGVGFPDFGFRYFIVLGGISGVCGFCC